jgi:hypothetical protein
MKADDTNFLISCKISIEIIFLIRQVKIVQFKFPHNKTLGPCYILHSLWLLLLLPSIFESPFAALGDTFFLF